MAPNKEHDALISSYEHLPTMPRAADALHTIRKIASLVKPIMRKHGWRVRILSEFYPDDQRLLGMFPSTCARYFNKANDPVQASMSIWVTRSASDCATRTTTACSCLQKKSLTLCSTSISTPPHPCRPPANRPPDCLITSSVLTTTNFTNCGKSFATNTKNSPSKASPVTLSYPKVNASVAATSLSKKCADKLGLQLNCASNERPGLANDSVVLRLMLVRTFDPLSRMLLADA